VIDDVILEDVKKIRTNLEGNAFSNKRLLITGGAGFLGSWLCDCLIGLDTEIYCLDNFSTGKADNVEHLKDCDNFKLIDEDVCDFKSDVKFDFILHLASHASPMEYQKHPIETLRGNSLGSFNMLELARRCDATLMFTSTSEIYGDAEVIPTPENYWGNVNPIGPRSCYDEGKRFAEALLMAYHREYGLDVKIARIFNTYGPRIRADGLYGRVVSRFIVQALSNKPITVYGDGKQTRSFCYVVDTVLGLLLLSVNRRAKGQVLNIGNPQEITILELAQKIKRLTDSASPITFHPLPEDDPRRRCPDVSRAERVLGWIPRISLEQGLARTITWFQRNIK